MSSITPSTTTHPQLRREAQRMLNKQKTANFDPRKHFRSDLITGALRSAISTGNWSLKRFKMDRAGVTAGGWREKGAGKV